MLTLEERIKALHCWTFVRGSIGDCWIPLTKWSITRKVFHIMIYLEFTVSAGWLPYQVECPPSISTGYCKKDVSYVFLALTHRYIATKCSYRRESQINVRRLGTCKEHQRFSLTEIKQYLLNVGHHVEASMCQNGNQLTATGCHMSVDTNVI